MLCALSLVAAIGGGAGIVALESSGLYVNDLDTLQDQECNSIADTIAKNFARRYAVTQLGDLPYVLREEMFPNPENRSDSEHWTVKLQLGDTVLVQPDTSKHYTIEKTVSVEPLYPVISEYGPDYKPESTESTSSDPTLDTEPTEPIPPDPGLPPGSP